VRVTGIEVAPVVAAVVAGLVVLAGVLVAVELLL